jgi:hypothetical protein
MARGKTSQSDSKKSANATLISRLAYRRSITVSNAPMRAARYSEAAEKVASGTPFDQLGAVPLVFQVEVDRTGRKDEKSTRKEENDSTMPIGQHVYIPDGYDSVVIGFDLKITNSTKQPHSIKLETWDAMRERKVILDGKEYSVHQAMTARAREVLALVAQQVFSGDWAWRNRTEAANFIVAVSDEAGNVVPHAQSLGEAMFEAFTSGKPAMWRVVGIFRQSAGRIMRVYPSQLFKIDVSDIEKKRAEYYRIPATGDGNADFALRSVKIANRLKCIDTWYARYAVFQRPIPVEPMGYVQELLAVVRGEDETAASILMRALGYQKENNKWSDQPVLKGAYGMSEKEALYLSGITLFGGLLTADDGATDDKDKAGGSKKKDSAAEPEEQMELSMNNDEEEA